MTKSHPCKNCEYFDDFEKPWCSLYFEDPDSIGCTDKESESENVDEKENKN